MQDSMVGRFLGQYELIALIGKGGMARVYRSIQPALERPVAVKLLHPSVAADEEFLVRFQREAKAAASLRHPHIVQIFDFGRQEELYYMVMEFIDGPTLREELQRLKVLDEIFPFSEVQRIIEEVSEALDYAHERGIIHRDVKPANILLTPENQAVLSDFGLAFMIEGPRQTITGFVGTPEYMSPEQGQGMAVDGRTDVYSLGVVLYEMLTGRVPFTSKTPVATVMKHISEPLPPPRSINPDIPEGVVQVLLKAMSKDPRDRYSRAGELSRALAEAFEAAAVVEAPTAVPIPPPPVAAPPTPIIPGPLVTVAEERRPERSKLPLMIAVLGAALLAVIVLAMIVANIGEGFPFIGEPTVVGEVTGQVVSMASDTPSPTVVPTEAQPTATVAVISTPTAAPTVPATASPTPIKATSTPMPTPTRPAPTATPTPTTKPTSEPTKLPTVTSYKNRIIFKSDREGGEALYVMNPDGSDQRRLDDESVYHNAFASEIISPDGKWRLEVREIEGNVDLWKIAGAQEHRITSDASIDQEPVWAPIDQNRIAFVSTRGGNTDVWTQNVNEPYEERQLTDNPDYDKHPSWSPDGTQIVYWAVHQGGPRQIWVMDAADGSNKRNISNNNYNDWDPVWIK